METGLQVSPEPIFNPLDVLEDIAETNEWSFDRIDDHELVAELQGRWCDFRLFFVWREDVSALHFTCAFEARVRANRRREVNDLLSLVNEKLWLGHFDVSSEDGLPMFRHTMPLRGMRVSSEAVEDLVEVALAECERFFPAFQFVLWGGKSAQDAMTAAMFETVGEA